MKDILFVDDNNIVLETFKAIVEQYNYSVEICNNSLKGLDLALENDFALIITDYKMPGLDGIEFIKRVKNIKPSSNIYLLTGYYDNHIVEKVLESGANGLMKKPFEVSKILTIMNSKFNKTKR